MGLRVQRIVRTESADLAIRSLKAANDKPSRSIVRKVAAIELQLRGDCQYGEVIKKSQIPASLRAKYGLENLYKVDLPDFWRLFYTIVRIDEIPSVTILEIVDHDAYNKWFPSER